MKYKSEQAVEIIFLEKKKQSLTKQCLICKMNISHFHRTTDAKTVDFIESDGD